MVKASTSALLILGALAIGYVIYKKSNPKMTPQETASYIAVANNTSSYTTPTGSYVQVGNTTYKTSSPQTSVSSPELWQKTLIWADRWVPGTFLTRFALG